MKKVFYLAGIAFLCSCGGSTNDSTSETSDSTVTAENKPKEDNSILDPTKDDLSGVIHSIDLINSMNVYFGKDVQLIVYPRVYVDGDPFKQGMYGSASAEGDEYAVAMTFTTLPVDAVVKGQPYLVKGKIESIGFYNELKMIDVELLELPASYKLATFNPKAISSTNIYDPATITASIMAWDKKIITVTGDYWGTSISKSVDGKELLGARVDLGSTGDYKVGCDFPTEEGANAFSPSEKGVKIKGELSCKLLWGNPQLSNCSRVD